MYFLYKHYYDNKVFYVGIGKCRKNNGISKYHRAYDESKRSVAWKEKNRLGKKFSEKSIALISYKSKGNKNAIGYRSYAAKLKYSFAKLGNTYAKGKFGNKSGKLLNVETGLIFDNIHEINDFFFNGSVKTFLTLKTYIAKGVTFKGLTFYRV